MHGETAKERETFVLKILSCLIIRTKFHITIESLW